MSFFVVLYALEAAGDKANKNEVMAAIKIAFGPEPDPNSTDPIDMLILNHGKPRPPRNLDKGNADDSARGLDGTDP